MLKALLVDDNLANRLFLREILEQTELVGVVGEAENSHAALKEIALLQPDVVFLDIQMEEKNSGVLLAKEAMKAQPCIKIVFITAFQDYAVEAFELNSVDYILKPYDEKRVKTCILRLYEQISRKTGEKPNVTRDKILLKMGSQLRLVKCNDIYFIEKSGQKVNVHARSNKGVEVIEVYEKLNDLETRLASTKRFIRSHKSFIINLEYVTGIVPWTDSSYEVLFYGYNKTALINRINLDKIKTKFGV